MAAQSDPPLAPKKPLVRDHFTTTLGIFVATLGSALGLGNLWKFPALTGANGGAAFVLAYIISTILVGLPVMISELVIGRSQHANAITSFRRLAPGKLWWLVGALGALAAFFILAFYTEVVAWVLLYIPKAISGELATSDPAVTEKVFVSLISNPVASLVGQWIVIAYVAVIIIAGVAKGIESVTRVQIPNLFAILILIGIRSLTLPGKSAEIRQGLAFLFTPDLTKLTFPSC